MKYAEYLTEFIGREGSLGLNGTVASLTYGESNMTSHKIVEVHEDFVVIGGDNTHVRWIFPINLFWIVDEAQYNAVT